MNKHKLIEKYEYLNHDCFRRVDTSEVLRDLKQLDESKKPVVPQFVVDWYEKHKDDFEFNVWDWIAFRNEPEKLENKEFSYWLNRANNKPLQTLANMHQFGYEVEEEKRYLVKVKGVEGYGRYLNKVSSSKTYCFASENENYGYITKHTRKELEDAGFGWVFDCEGIEIEEVE